MRKVVGLAGRAESGKTTAAKMLHSILQPEKAHMIEFSEPILSLAQNWLDQTPSDATLESALGEFKAVAVELGQKSLERLTRAGRDSPLLIKYFAERPNLTVNPETKGQHRMVLEWLGKGVVDHVDPAYWADIVQDKALQLLEDGADLITLCGVRSAYDAQAVRNVGGSIIRLTRGSYDQLLPSEAGINTWREDFYIANNGTLKDLHTAISNLELANLPEVAAM